MPLPVIYVYILKQEQFRPSIFTWPNVCRKYIRDTYTLGNGKLCLPPGDILTLERHKVNPKPEQTPVIDRLDIAEFMKG
jgi:hypothetical protein